jgi:hypothetical protein
MTISSDVELPAGESLPQDLADPLTVVKLRVEHDLMHKFKRPLGTLSEACPTDHQ